MKNSGTNKKVVAVRSALVGLLGSLGLFTFYYLVLIAVTGDPTHPLTQIKLFQPWMSLLIIGFGIQVFFYSLLKNGVQFRLSREEKGEATAVAGTGGVVSGVSMAACCVHHVADLVPVIGISGTALFLTEYQKEFLILGVIANMLGILFMIWMLLGKQKPTTIVNYLLSRRNIK